MKKFVIMIIPVVLMLTGCMAKIPEVDHALEAQIYDTMEACYAAQKHDAATRPELTAEQYLLAEAIQGLREASGKKYDPCAGITTNNDVVVAIARENTKRQEALVSGGTKLVTGGVIAYGSKQLANVLTSAVGAGGTTVSGDNATITQNKAGGDVSTSLVEEVPATAEEEVIDEGAIDETKATE